MTTKVEKSIVVNVPVSTAYNQWTQFAEFPQFMGGVTEVRQLDDRRLHWVAEIAGVKREWEATILEQVADQKVAWAATSGATNAGAVYFEPISSAATSVRLSLEYEPEGVVEKVGDKLNIVEKQAEADLAKFKTFIESRGAETGAWRGGVSEGAALGTPGVDAARASEGDSGKAGLSGKVLAGAAAAAVAGVAAAGAAKAKSSGDTETGDTTTTTETVSETTYSAPPPSSPIVEQPTPAVSSGLGTSSGVGTSSGPETSRPADPMGVPATDIAFSAGVDRDVADPHVLLDRDPDLAGRGDEGLGR